MKIRIKKRNSGFVILYAVMISSIILAITLGVVNISLKEIKFGTSARDTNNAFFAADAGAECALYYDRSSPANNAFTGTAGPNISCAGASITISGSSPSWNFIVPGLGSSGQGCAKVNVIKNPSTTIISKGYNNGGASCIQNSSTVERQLEVNY
ncbi:MAG: hypothetical protein WC447_01870 [Candidatus Paceibacterota bacterium]